MIKAFGALVLLAACLVAAAERIRLLRERVRILEAFDRLLTEFSGAVQSGSPLPVIFRELGRRSYGEGFAEAAALMHRSPASAGDCYREGILRHYAALTAEDKAALCTLGEGLGLCDVQTQKERIAAARELTALQCRLARDAARKEGRLSLWLSLCGGGCLIVLLI